MKKILTLVAVCALFAACGSVESEAIKRLEKIDAAYKAGDEERALKLSADIEKWEQSLNDEDRAKVQAAVLEWTINNIFTE